MFPFGVTTAKPTSVDPEQAFTLVRRIIVFNIQVARTYCLFNANDMNVPGPGTFMSFACLPHSFQSFPLCLSPSRSAGKARATCAVNVRLQTAELNPILIQ